jgi:very-short-patch-repair endonuclease
MGDGVMAKKKKKLSKKKELERIFVEALLKEKDIPPWHNAPGTSNYRFNRPDNQMQLDLAWPEFKVGVEINGGQWSQEKMGHNSGKGVERDAKKNNWANLKGWLIIILVTDHIKKQLYTYAIPTLRNTLKMRGASVVTEEEILSALNTWMLPQDIEEEDEC